MTTKIQSCYDCGHNQGIHASLKSGKLRCHCSAHGGWEPYHSRRCSLFKGLTKQSTLDTV
jgi:hypothetical protein